MFDVDRITDFDQLKQVVSLLNKENKRLHQKLVKLTRELATLRGESAQRLLALEIGSLQSQMDLVQRQLGKVSEKRGTGPQDSSEEKPKQRGHGPRLQPLLAVEEQIDDVFTGQIGQIGNRVSYVGHSLGRVHGTREAGPDREAP